MEILCYTRKPLESGVYSEKLAFSMHLAFRKNKGEKFKPLNRNEGVLYAKATENKDGTLTAKCLCSPVIFEKKSGGFGITAKQTDSGGKLDTGCTGKVLYFESSDLVHFEQIGLIDEQDIKHENVVNVCVSAEDISEIEGCVPGGVIEVSQAVGEYIIKKLSSPPSKHKTEFDFPFAEKRADPFCFRRNGKFYFIATNDADGNKSLYIRCADTIKQLSDAQEVLILDTETYGNIKGLLWAPEIHEIKGEIYIFLAATDSDFFSEEAHVMKLKSGGDLMKKEDWSKPKKVTKKDGSDLCEAGKVISLDMTVFEYEEEYYAMWSQRRFDPVDEGAWLYIAKINSKEPHKLLTDPVCIAKPEYSWENNHTFVTEGPFALRHGGKLMISYSAAMVDSTYTVGLLKPTMGSDILKAENWKKSNYPLLSSRSFTDEYGPGHNCFVEDENGQVYIFYHAKNGIDGPRCTGIRRIFFDIDAEPVAEV